MFADASNRNAPISNKVKFSLAIGLLAVLVLATLVYFNQSVRIQELNSELALKDLQLVEAKADISSQSQQIEAKGAQLEQLNLEIAQMESEIQTSEQLISLQDTQIAELSQRVALQRDELQGLRLEAAGLQDEIGVLESKIQDNEKLLQSSERIRVQHYSLAVDQDDNGLVLPIEVEIIPSGDGTVSIDVKNVKYETGFQSAVRDAVEFASEHSGIKVSDKDVIIRVVNDFNDPQGELTIDGGSAGALITAMTIAGLSGEQINSSVLVTGTIEPDGTVGRIGGLDKKAQAAADFGAKTLLVPEGQQFTDPAIQIVGVSDIDDLMKYIVQ